MVHHLMSAYKEQNIAIAIITTTGLVVSVRKHRLRGHHIFTPPDYFVYRHKKDNAYRQKLLRVMESADRIRGNDDITRKTNSLFRGAELYLQNSGGHYQL